MAVSNFQYSAVPQFSKGRNYCEGNCVLSFIVCTIFVILLVTEENKKKSGAFGAKCPMLFVLLHKLHRRSCLIQKHFILFFLVRILKHSGC